MASGDRFGRSTIVEVARAAGVSRQTVSNAVSKPDRLRPETLRRVLAEVDRLKYRPSSAAQKLRHQRAGAVGIELDAVRDTPSDVAHPFLVALALAGLQHGYHLVPFASRDTFPMLSSYQEMVRRQLVDAFVLSDTHRHDPRPGWLTAAGVPFASYGRVYDDPTTTLWADVDGAAGVAMAVEHLHARGYAKVAFLGWPKGSAVGDDRRLGWERATDVATGPARGPSATSYQDLPQVIATAASLLDLLQPGDAVACASDVLALGLHHAAVARGWRPGRDLGITGFDGSASARLYGITTLVQPLDDIAELLLALVGRQMAGLTPPTQGSLLSPTLSIGPSTTIHQEGSP